MSFIAELKRRNVSRVGLRDIVSSSLMLQIQHCMAQGIIDYHVHHLSHGIWSSP